MVQSKPNLHSKIADAPTSFSFSHCYSLSAALMYTMPNSLLINNYSILNNDHNHVLSYGTKEQISAWSIYSRIFHTLAFQSTEFTIWRSLLTYNSFSSATHRRLNVNRFLYMSAQKETSVKLSLNKQKKMCRGQLECHRVSDRMTKRFWSKFCSIKNDSL